MSCLLRLFSSLVTFFLCPSSFLHPCHPQLYYTLISLCLICSLHFVVCFSATFFPHMLPSPDPPKKLVVDLGITRAESTWKPVSTKAGGAVFSAGERGLPRYGRDLCPQKKTLFSCPFTPHHTTSAGGAAHFPAWGTLLGGICLVPACRPLCCFCYLAPVSSCLLFKDCRSGGTPAWLMLVGTRLTGPVSSLRTTWRILALPYKYWLVTVTGILQVWSGKPDHVQKQHFSFAYGHILCSLKSSLLHMGFVAGWRPLSGLGVLGGQSQVGLENSALRKPMRSRALG